LQHALQEERLGQHDEEEDANAARACRQRNDRIATGLRASPRVRDGGIRADGKPAASVITT